MTPVKTAEQKIEDLRTFVPNARRAVEQFQALLERLEAEAEFRTLWNTDPAAALQAVGIDPDSRMEMGLESYRIRGAECRNCVTPMGHACHC